MLSYFKVGVLSLHSHHYENMAVDIHMGCNNIEYCTQITNCPMEQLNPQFMYFPISSKLKIEIYHNKITDKDFGQAIVLLDDISQSQKEDKVSVKCFRHDRETNQSRKQVFGLLGLIIVRETREVTLQMDIKQGELLRDTEIVTKMDPYVECKVGEQTMYTEVLEEAGHYPKWNQRLQFKLDQLPDKIAIKVHDRDVTSDDLVGEAAMSPHLDGILRPTAKSQKHSLNLAYKNKKAGTLILGTRRFIVI